MSPRRCRHCDRILRKGKSPRARYCSDSCKVMAYQQREARRERLATASRSIALWAPAGATGYRLGIRQDAESPLVLFPRLEALSINPLEPPRVPVPGVYVVEFYDDAGDRIPTPASLAHGLYIKSADPSVRFYRPTTFDGPPLPRQPARAGRRS